MLEPVHTSRKVGLAIGYVFLLLIPGLLIGHFFLAGAASVFFFGAIPIAAAFFGGARHQAVPIIGFMVLTGTLGQVFQGNAWLLALLLSVVAGVIGLTARRGLTSPVLNVGIVLGFLIMSPPKLGQGTTQFQIVLDPILATALLLTLGGLWALFISSIVHKDTPKTSETSSRALAAVVPYALALAISTGISTFFLITYQAGSLGAWLLLTIFVVLKPDQNKTIERTRSRISGTVLGAGVAFIAIEILRWLDYSNSGVQLTIALLFVGVAFAFYVPGPYWVYVTFLTPGVVLLDSNAVSDQTTVDLYRLVYTLAGIALALLSGLLIRLLSTVFFTRDQSH
jgi:hypothetical protein